MLVLRIKLGFCLAELGVREPLKVVFDERVFLLDPERILGLGQLLGLLLEEQHPLVNQEELAEVAEKHGLQVVEIILPLSYRRLGSLKRKHFHLRDGLALAVDLSVLLQGHGLAKLGVVLELLQRPHLPLHLQKGLDFIKLVLVVVSI